MKCVLSHQLQLLNIEGLVDTLILELVNDSIIESMMIRGVKLSYPSLHR